MENITISQNVAILCDGNNIERSIHEISKSKSTMINFDELIPRLLNGRGLNRLIYFREGKSISSKFADRLHENFYGTVIPCHKSADIPLSIKATQLSSKVDTIIIMSGDSDFVELVRHLKAEGVRVEIAAVKNTTAKILQDEAAFFHEITESDWFKYKNKSH
ncbi:MAG: NYN domain-containing protein [Candidatus Neomarinimicrobiota bacterium]|nr:NYN domain-containing protein [Candidatus Neomarinimicrobiota bacterium]|tara:strand:- start:577 stop:1062 length:486 start_codon:yes stop_codon:yes gene_type:complete